MTVNKDELKVRVQEAWAEIEVKRKERDAREAARAEGRRQEQLDDLLRRIDREEYDRLPWWVADIMFGRTEARNEQKIKSFR